jgi:hypothetical protein
MLPYMQRRGIHTGVLCRSKTKQYEREGLLDAWPMAAS